MGRPAKALSGSTGPRVQIPPSPPRDAFLVFPCAQAHESGCCCDHSGHFRVSNCLVTRDSLFVFEVSHCQAQRLLVASCSSFQRRSRQFAEDELGDDSIGDFRRRQTLYFDATGTDITHGDLFPSTDRHHHS